MTPMPTMPNFRLVLLISAIVFAVPLYMYITALYAPRYLSPTDNKKMMDSKQVVVLDVMQNSNVKFIDDQTQFLTKDGDSSATCRCVWSTVPLACDSLSMLLVHAMITIISTIGLVIIFKKSARNNEQPSSLTSYCDSSDGGSVVAIEEQCNDPKSELVI